MSASDTVESAPLTVTVLGSGASSFGNGRANAGHVVNVDGDPRFLLDAGGGVGARLAEADVDLPALEAAFVGHLHIDHTADLPAVVKAAYQRDRDRPFPIYGPTGTDEFPGIEAFVSRLFDPETGAYSYLSSFVDRYKGGDLAVDPRPVDATIGGHDEPTRIHDGAVTVEAIPETHGEIPTLAYRFDYDGTSITFSGDTSLETGNLQRLASGTDLLVHNRIIDADDDPDEPKTALHSYAEDIGASASAADAGALVLSHISQHDDAAIRAEMDRIAAAYDGPIAAARDLVSVTPDGQVTPVEPVENEILRG
ncbi:MAG: MBL fold metallo-hydrolase [Haloferacaceae archaeon]